MTAMTSIFHGRFQQLHPMHNRQICKVIVEGDPVNAYGEQPDLRIRFLPIETIQLDANCLCPCYGNIKAWL